MAKQEGKKGNNIGKVGYKRPPVEHQFKKGNKTPPAELKKEGWDRRREAQRIMDMVMQYGGMTVAELQKIAEKKRNTLTVMEARIMKYVSNDKYLTDWLDRHISKAPTEISGPDGTPNTITIKFKD